MSKNIKKKTVVTELEKNSSSGPRLALYVVWMHAYSVYGLKMFSVVNKTRTALKTLYSAFIKSRAVPPQTSRPSLITIRTIEAE